MGCIRCGASPTVKSHIIPRALFHLMKRPGRPLVGGRADGPGYKILQSGDWDNTFLCKGHEAELGRFDAYGVRFCRSFKQMLERGLREIRVRNSQPQLLVGFATACVWRMAVSRSDHRPERLLGPYANRLANSLFGNQRFNPLLLLSCHGFHDNAGDLLNIGVLPHVYYEEGIRFWRFIVCGLIFDLKLDNRSPVRAMEPLAVNEKMEIVLFEDFPQEILRTRLAESLFRMAVPSGSGRRQR